jgi:hypothetical protein
MRKTRARQPLRRRQLNRRHPPRAHRRPSLLRRLPRMRRASRTLRTAAITTDTTMRDISDRFQSSGRITTGIECTGRDFTGRGSIGRSTGITAIGTTGTGSISRFAFGTGLAGDRLGLIVPRSGGRLALAADQASQHQHVIVCGLRSLFRVPLTFAVSLPRVRSPMRASRTNSPGSGTIVKLAYWARQKKTPRFLRGRRARIRQAIPSSRSAWYPPSLLSRHHG